MLFSCDVVALALKYNNLLQGIVAFAALQDTTFWMAPTESCVSAGKAVELMPKQGAGAKECQKWKNCIQIIRLYTANCVQRSIKLVKKIMEPMLTSA